MTLPLLAWRYVASKPLVNALTALSVAFGVALLVACLSLSSALRESALRTAADAQLLVAAKGSPFQAVLSTLFYAEPPTGTVPLSLLEELRQTPGVTRVTPFSFGDNYRGHFIVGTDPDYLGMLEEKLGRHPRTTPQGRWPNRDFEAVIGWAAAQRTGLSAGAEFTANHGLVETHEDLREAHDGRPYRVVAVLERTDTPADRAIFTTLDTIWKLHEVGVGQPHVRQLTALLVRGAGYGDVARLSGALSRRGDVQAIFPGRVVTRLVGYLDTGRRTILAISAAAGSCAFVTVLISILAAAADRRRQIATLRAIGAAPRDIVALLMAEALIIVGGGAVVGLALGKLAFAVFAARVERAGAPPLASTLGVSDLAVVLGAIGLALAAGAVPAWLACRADVARDLAASS